MGINLKKELEKQIKHCEMMLRITKQSIKRKKIEERLNELKEILCA